MFVVPAGPAVVAKPKLVMTAICGSEEVQFAKRVMLCVLPSLKAPTAVNACEPPIGMLALLGEMVIDVSVAFVTFTVALPTMPLNTAVTFVWPGFIPVIIPD